MNTAQTYIAAHDLYGRRIDRLEIAAADALDRGELAQFVGLTALAEEIAIAGQKALKRCLSQSG